MKTILNLFILGCLMSTAKAQPGYQYNGATGRYEYNTDPLGGIAQRFQNYANMQIGTLQRMNQNTLNNNQLMQQSLASLTGDVRAEIEAAILLGKSRIASGKVTNVFNWVLPEKISASQKQQATLIKERIKKNDLNINNYADVKAFFVVSYFLVLKDLNDESIVQKKGEAKRLGPLYLTNEYIQGMSDEMKTTNILGEIENLGKITAAGPKTEEAKKLAKAALINRGYDPVWKLELSANGLVVNQNKRITNASSTFKRIPQVLFINEMIKANKLPTENVPQYRSYMAQFDSLVMKINGPDNDYAFGQAVAFTVCYTIYSDGKVFTPRQIDGTFKLLYQNLMENEWFQSLSDPLRQSQYERIATECMAISDLYAVAQRDKMLFEKKLNDPNIDATERFFIASNTQVYDRIKMVKTMAHNKLKELFKPLDFNAYVLGDDGFTKQ